MTPSICLDPLYPSLLTEDKIPRVAAAGFRHVEFWGWRDKDIPAIEAACRKHPSHPALLRRVPVREVRANRTKRKIQNPSHVRKECCGNEES
jgi:hypothetical protein